MSAFTDNVEILLRIKGIGKYKFYGDVGISAASFGKWKRGSNPSFSANRKNPVVSTATGFFFDFQRFPIC